MFASTHFCYVNTIIVMEFIEVFNAISLEMVRGKRGYLKLEDGGVGLGGRVYR